MSSQLPTLYQQYIHLSRYARWLESEKRRETWEETVTRYINFMCDVQCPGLLSGEEKEELRQAILNLEIMPSMRALMTAGKALERDNCAGYNCAYLAINRVRAFAETLYILMCGTGVGFSVERQEINKLPDVPEEIYPTDTTVVVSDSRVGWSTALDELLNLLYAGKVPQVDYSKIRPAGARLKTFGGRASGPNPLKDLFKFVINKFNVAKGRKLTSLEVHDTVCKIAEIVVVGGVRRSALISLSNLSDERMRGAKSGEWWSQNVQRSLANNSVCYKDRPESILFSKEWISLVKSKSGERGIFNRSAADKQVARFGRREPYPAFGTNPCSEILLRDRQFCNLTEVVIRKDDTLKSLKRKVKLATILGTMQSTFTKFRFLSKEWTKNCEEERLLGVSLTGVMDNAFLACERLEETVKFFIDDELSEDALDREVDSAHYMVAKALQSLRLEAVKTNEVYASKLGINQSAAITCVKPSGTVSQLVDTASGIHTRYSPYYIRTVRADKKDPLAQFMKEVGFPCEDDVTKPDSVYVFSFPIKAPEGAIVSEDRTALEQLELWLLYQNHYCEHKPSVTINVKDDEWLEVGAWVYKHFDKISGISFLPWNDHVYKQAPYQPITEQEYHEFMSNFIHEVDWSRLQQYEKEDTTMTSKEFACTGNSCELVDLIS